MAPVPPSGTITFLFSDVVGSTHLWAEDPTSMSASLQVRLGLHLGEAEERNGDYFGPVVNLAARVEAAGHGGQTLVTDVVRQAAQVDARQLGVFSLRGVSEKVAIFQVGGCDFPPLRVADSTSTNLPSAPTALIGRADDVRSIRTALRTSRLVTLVAGGGTGKTRLSLAVGDEELPSRRAGVWFVDLTPVADPQDLEAAIASAMGVELTMGDATQQILEFMSDKDLLLILDNCEHLVVACADFAEAFLMRPGESQLLTTSRERLDVHGERALQIPPLAVSDADSPAAQLFVERATTASSGFTVDADGLAAIVELCRRLDGLPLAIELAAARSTILTPAELLAGIDDRFRLLHGGRRRQRQRTLESTLDWSYNLLDDEEQRALRLLGIFSGTFDLDAATTVLGVSRHVAIDHVESLVAKSLVERIPVDGISRFRLLETTAAYAQHALAANGESEAARDLHLEHYHRASEPFWERSLFWGFAPAVDRFSRDRSNIVAAFDWASAQGRPQLAAELLSGALGALLDDDLGAMRLIDAAIESIDNPEDPRALALHESRLAAATVATDWGGVLASTQVLGASSSPTSRVIGTGWGAFLSLAFDPGHSRRLFDAAEVGRPRERAARTGRHPLRGLPPGDAQPGPALRGRVRGRPGRGRIGFRHLGRRHRERVQGSRRPLRGGLPAPPRPARRGDVGRHPCSVHPEPVRNAGLLPGAVPDRPRRGRRRRAPAPTSRDAERIGTRSARGRHHAAAVRGDGARRGRPRHGPPAAADHGLPADARPLAVQRPPRRRARDRRRVRCVGGADHPRRPARPSAGVHRGLADRDPTSGMELDPV